MSLVTPEVDMDEEDAASAVDENTAQMVDAQENAEAKAAQDQEEEKMTEDNSDLTTEEPIKEVAVQEEAAPPAIAKQREAGISQHLADEAALGFEGLEIGTFSFDRIKLDDGSFLLGSEEKSIGTKFSFQVLAMRPVFIIRQCDEQDAEMFYSYDRDGGSLTDGSSSQDTLDKWLEDGFEKSDIDIKEYSEVTAEMVDREDEYQNAIVMLQIPPTSRQRLGGMSFMAKQRFKVASIGDVVIEASVGGKAGTGSKSFRPWNFNITRKA